MPCFRRASGCEAVVAALNRAAGVAARRPGWAGTARFVVEAERPACRAPSRRYVRHGATAASASGACSTTRTTCSSSSPPTSCARRTRSWKGLLHGTLDPVKAVL